MANGSTPPVDDGIARRLAAKVDVRGPDECWPWTGATNGKGYGQLTINDRRAYAHRIAWMMEHGTIPDGLCVCHTCDTPACCNPAHLFLGTKAENSADMIAKGRTRHGGRHWKTRMTEPDVRAMRAAVKAGVSIADVARAFGLNYYTAHSIVRGENWRYLDRDADAGRVVKVGLPA